MNIHTKWDKQIQCQIRIDPEANAFCYQAYENLVFRTSWILRLLITDKGMQTF